eukprot:14159040-Alexandrium_andersonii.AAC.1
MAEEFREHAASRALDKAKAKGQLPPVYFEHPAVRESSGQVFPVGLYLDGVKFTRQDSVLGIWMYSVLSGR